MHTQSRRTLRWWINFLTCVSVMLIAASACAWQVESSLVRFDGISDGGWPAGPLLADDAQNLYGTTTWNGAFDSSCYGWNGGGTDCGTVFKLSPPQQPGGAWSETVLYRFTGGLDGAQPSGALAMDKAGNLYGTTNFGGGLDDNGVAYQLSPPVNPGDPWTETILHIFARNDGQYPNGVIIDDAGNLFGTTEFGGTCGQTSGNAFELSPPVVPGDPWTEKVIYSFHCKGNSDPDGIDPVGHLIQGPAGSFYGVTAYSGKAQGTVFRISPPAPGHTAWTEKVLYTFQDGPDGAYPSGGVTQYRGKLYGATTFGGSCTDCGTLFELTPPLNPNGAWTKQTIYNFAGGTDGKIPSEVAFDKQGNLYGITSKGGNVACRSNQMGACGTVYKLSPPVQPGDPWTRTTLHAFVGVQDGMFPSSSVLIGRAGSLFGTTSSGGDLNCSINGSKGCGVVYKIVP